MRNDTGLFIPLLHEMEVLVDFTQHPSYDHPTYQGYTNTEWHDVKKVLKHPEVSGYHALYRWNGLRAITDRLALELLNKARDYGLITTQE